MSKKRGENKLLVFAQLLILIISIFAFCWMLNQEFENVTAWSGDSPTGGVEGKWENIVYSVLGIAGVESGGLLGTVATITAAYSAGQLFTAVFAMFASGRNMDAINSAIWYITGAITLAVITLVILVYAGISLGILSCIPVIGWIAAAIEIVLLSLWVLMTYQNYAQDIFAYSVSIWKAPSGGKNCERCNDLEYGCSEYQCHAFGKACNITNAGTTEERCVWLNPGDITGPEITPSESVLELGYEYSPIGTISLPDKGVKIIYNGEGKDENLCIPPFTDLTLGVKTNEPAECRIDTSRKNNLSDMMSPMAEGGLITYNHNLTIPSYVNPSGGALSNLGINLSSNQEYSFYILCEDTNGNPSTSFLMQFCVQRGPDTMSPLIKGTNYLNEKNYVPMNLEKAYLQVYTNEPADCKWDFQNLEYDKMIYSMSKCSQNLTDFLIPSMLKYGCETNLTGIKNYEDNYYYIRCKDQPWLKNTPDEIKRNANRKSYTFILIGTSDLVIDDVSINSKPNNTIIKDSANQTKVTIGVTASGGAEEGKVKCQYKFGNNYLNFYNEGSLDYLIENKQSLWLEKGKYNYEIKCFDIAGNTAFTSVGFTIEQDVSSPTIVRAYSEEGKIKLITNEEAVCVYSITSCNYNFDDGVEMETTDSASHFIDWTTETDLFVKCKDMFGNRPLQDKCSIIVRGSEF
jgi:hypothetical protein